MSKPTAKEVVDLRDELRAKGLIKTGSRKGDQRGVRPTHVELQKRGYTVCLAFVQRVLAHVDKINGADQIKSGTKGAPKGNANAISNPIKREDVMRTDPSLVSTMAALLNEENTSATLASRENRVRMALNIVIAERMAASPNLLILDMRGAAALVDALTKAAQLSGGASLDVRSLIKQVREETEERGNEMKDITPAAKTALQTDIAKWKETRKNGAAAS